MESFENGLLYNEHSSNHSLMRSGLQNYSLGIGNMSMLGALDAGDLLFQRVISILHVYVLPVIILIGILGNTVSFLVYVGTPRLCRQSSSMYLAFRAAIDNVSLIFVFVVWFGWVGIHIFHKNGWCQTVLYCMYVCSFLSVWTVVSFTCERWIVVFHPLKRHRLCTRKRALIVMASLTISALAFYTFSIFTTRVRYASGLPICSQSPRFRSIMQVIRSVDTMFTVIIPSITIVIMNIAIGIKICRYTNTHTNSLPLSPDSRDEISSFSSKMNSDTRLNQRTPSALSVSASSSRMKVITKKNTSRFRTKRQQTQLKVTRALLIVSSVFVLLNLPSYAFRIQAFVITVRQEQYNISIHAFIWQEFIQFLYYINQSCNFFLYFACSRNFRLAVKRLLHRFRRNFKRLRCMQLRLASQQESAIGREREGARTYRGDEIREEGKDRDGMSE